MLFALCALLAMSAFPVAASAATQGEIDAAIDEGAQWLRSQQGPGGPDPYTGQIPGFGGDWSVTALAAAGVDPAGVRNLALGPPSLQDHLLGVYGSGPWLDPPSFAKPVTDYETAVLSAYAAGLDPARISAGSNLPAQIAGVWNAATGSFGTPSSNGTAFGILALARTPVPRWALAPAVDYLRQNRHDDGGWNFGSATTPGAKATPSDPEMTGAAIAALCESGVPTYDADVAGGVEFLRGKLEANGAIEAPFGTNVDTNAWVISGLNACGIDPQSAAWTTGAGKTPVDYVLSLQVTTPGPDAGGFGYNTPEFPGVYSTQDALRALADEAFTASPLSGRGVQPVAAGTPVSHVLAIEFAPGNVRMCKVTAPSAAPLTEVLAAAKAASYPPGCVRELAVSGGEVDAIDGIEPENADESWLARLDRGPVAAAGQQPVGFGDVISLHRGLTPVGTQVVTGPAGAAGPTGQAGRAGKRGARGRPGKAKRKCRVSRGRDRHRSHRGKSRGKPRAAAGRRGCNGRRR
jgi:hypothetical protein